MPLIFTRTAPFLSSRIDASATACLSLHVAHRHWNAPDASDGDPAESFPSPALSHNNSRVEAQAGSLSRHSIIHTARSTAPVSQCSRVRHKHDQTYPYEHEYHCPRQKVTTNNATCAGRLRPHDEPRRDRHLEQSGATQAQEAAGAQHANERRRGRNGSVESAPQPYRQ